MQYAIMKFKKTIFVLAMLPVIWVGCEGRYQRSPQGKLERIVASGRDNFELREILGEDWKAVCFLPHSYNFPSATDWNVQQRPFTKFLQASLGRPINPMEDWGGFWETVGDSPFMKVLTDKTDMGDVLSSVAWQPQNASYVICTRRPATKIQIVRGDGKYHLKYSFEKIFRL